MFNPTIYHSYDIRGVVPDEFNHVEAYHVGRAYAEYTGAKKVVVARDMRKTGNLIESELIHGLTDGGVDVIRIGLATTPLFYFAVHFLQADGGLSVTASHNPAKYNGVKMTGAKASPIGGDSGLYDIRDLVEKRTWAEVKRHGHISEADVKEAYLDMVAKDVSGAGLKIVVDAGNGMAGLLLKDYFERVGGEVVPLYWELDGTFPNHEANPLEEANMQDVKAAVIEHKADLGIAFDGDADRVFFVTEQGKTVAGDIATTLIAQEILKQQPGATILYDVRASRIVKEAVEAAGGKTDMSKVGHSNIKAHMRKTGALFAGEVSGHFYFAPWYMESALLALGYVLRLLQEKKQPMSELVAPLLKYAKTPEINFEVKDKEKVLARLKEHYSDAEILEADGVSIIYPEWWANVRPSNTEPLLRLNMEAEGAQLLQEKQAEIERLISA